MGRKLSVRLVRTYIEFVLSRLLGTGVDTLVLWICSTFILSDTYFGRNVVSPIISFEFAVMSNYVCSYFWIWRTRIEKRGMRTFWSRFVIFNLSSVAGFLVKLVFLQVFVITFKWNVVVCNLAALLISGILNFLLADTMVFRKRKTPRPQEPFMEMEKSPFDILPGGSDDAAVVSDSTPGQPQDKALLRESPADDGMTKTG